MVARFAVVFLVFLLLTGTGFSQTFDGFIDGYYGYNFNKPASRTNLYRNFDFNHNQFSLNYAELSVERKPGPVGFRVDIGFGDTATWVHASEPAEADVFRYLQQAYLSATKNKIQVDFGKFVTWSGAEVIETKDNWNYSRSLLFSWAIPYYHFGTRAVVAATDTVSIGGFVANGWNNVHDNNEGKTVGGQVVLKPTMKFTFTQNYTVGKEQGDEAVRHLVDSIATLNVAPNLSLMANYDYGMDRLFGRRVRWQGIALYARATPTPKFRVSPRIEWYDDPQGFTTNTRQTLKEGTLSLDYVMNGNMFLRGEYRYDWSNRAVFERNSGRPLSHQSTLTLGVVYTYMATR
jgi:Putative beta-barrel porin-2, OmpL-like. bbp2